jgi:hypothetical protein
MERDIGAALRQATDELNARYAEVAKRFTAYGVEASIPMGNSMSLEFRKSGDAWRLMVYRADSEQPLLSSSRRTRIEAAEYIPALFEQIKRNAACEVERTTQAQITLRVFLEQTKEQ